MLAPGEIYLLKAIFAPALTAAGVIALVSAPSCAAELLRGRCHMDTCTWFTVEEKDLTGSNNQGALFKVIMKGWESHHPNGNYDRRVPRQGGKPATSYFFCSKSKPAVIVQADKGRWQLDYLALNTPYGPPGALESTTATYYAVCHGVPANSPDAFIRLGRRFGYPVMEEAPEAPAITRPEDVLKR